MPTPQSGTSITMAADYAEQIYAGVLGKIIGVYLGRPVEGWSYPRLQERFGELSYYINDQLGEPLVVADDDVSGTFAFVRALADHEYPQTLQAQQVGDTWLNYIIENRTILWWGGLGRSTEHTAYLRLKSGTAAPASGSAGLNGTTLAEQVGAQIFSDGFAMAFPGDPTRAAGAVRAAASVSHDGVALEAAAFMAAMRALAFDVTELGELIDRSRPFIDDARLLGALDAVLSISAAESDWREVRQRIDHDFGYAWFRGPCHVIPNFAMTMAALLLGGDNFQRSVMIAASAGFDTDSNAGVVGCLNGIRLGLDALTAQVDLRAEVADRLLVVSSDGGSCVSDAVLESRKILAAASILRQEPAPGRRPRFRFEYRGSRQGFRTCPYVANPYPTVALGDGPGQPSSRLPAPGLRLRCTGVGPGVPAAVSTPVFLDAAETVANFSTIASPTLYPGQRVVADLQSDAAAVKSGVTATLYVVQRTAGGQISTTKSDSHPLTQERAALIWRIGDIGPLPILRVGVMIESPRRFDGDVTVWSIDWTGAPEYFHLEGVLLTSIWDTHPEPLRAWVSSAANFEADFDRTFSVSHPHGIGLATTGSTDWDDYTVSSTLFFSLHRQGGLVARSVGHRRYYAALLDRGNRVRLVKQRDGQCTVLAETAYDYHQDEPLDIALHCTGTQIGVRIEGASVLLAQDTSTTPYRQGAAGFLVDTGAILADGFQIRSLPTPTPRLP